MSATDYVREVLPPEENPIHRWVEKTGVPILATPVRSSRVENKAAN